MDLSARKYKFIEQFMKIVSPEKLERFEELLSDTGIENDEEIVAHTIDGKSVTKSQYINNNAEAVTSFEKGAFKTQSQIRNKYTVKS